MLGHEGGIATTRGSARAYRRDIDGLRAVAILGVLAYHFGLGGVTGGYGGVDVFFVISGFLIAGIIKSELDAGSFSIARFYVRRIRRILPALMVCALTTTVFAALILFPEDFRNYGRSLLSVATSTSNFYFMRRTGYFDGKAIEKPLLHTWSLGVEEQFYAFFPLLLLLLYKFGRRGAVPALVLIAVASLAYSVREVGIHPDQAFFSTAGRAWELLVGAFLAFGAVPILENRLAREAEAALGALLVAFGYFFYSDAIDFPGLAALPFCLGAALIIHAGGSGAPTGVSRMLSLPPMVGLGLISYSVYLWHWPLLVLSQYRLGALHGPFGVLLAVAGIGLGLLSWRFVEQPFRRTPVARSRTPVFISAALATTVLAVMSVAIAKRGYWFQRWPAEIVALASTGKDLSSAASFGLPMPADSGWPSGTYEMGFGARIIDTVLWGDSHALAILPGVASYLEKSRQRIIVAAHPGCPPLPSVTFYDSKYGGPCRGLNDATIANALGPNIKRVILTARWAAYAARVQFDIDGRAVALRRVVANDEAFSAVLEATVRRLTKSGKQVIIIGPVPEQQFDVKPALLRHLAWREPLPHKLTRSAFLETESKVLPLLSGLAKIPNVRVVYPDLILCAAKGCRYSNNGKPFYLDRDHLSPLGAAELGAMFAEIFDRGPGNYAVAP
jgi:peptidoglycan/LPS O-acetylase OafA/YrhL